MQKTMNLILFVLLTTLIAVSVLLAPSNATSGYWLSVGWLALLIFINWATSAGFFSLGKSENSGETGSFLGSLPSISILVLAYSITSFALLLASTWLNLLDQGLHLALQVSSFGIVAAICLTIVIATQAAQHGAHTLVTKSQLLSEIRRVRRASSDLVMTAELKSLESFISHSMPHPAKLNQASLEAIYIKLQSVGPAGTENLRDISQELRNL